MRSVLFFRTFRRLTGGHLKVWHYSKHVEHSPNYRSEICFTPGSVWDHSNPWFNGDPRPPHDCCSSRADVLFLAGSNWRHWEERHGDIPAVPIINLIQHLRHARPDDHRYPFLARRAVRICVSEEIGQAVSDARLTNGPIFVIPNAIDLAELPEPIPNPEKPVELLIAAPKEPRLGLELARQLERLGRPCDLLTTRLPRAEFLQRINQAQVTLFLPHRSEGFYLPALEGMALDTVVVCPDCQGNRSFCLPGSNAFRPSYTSAAILAAVEDARSASAAEKRSMLDQARATVAQHDLRNEREAFLQILENLPQIW